MPVPYLFVGAGFSIRYCGAESWQALLELFAEPLDKPYGYYASSANGDNPAIASLIAEDFHELWWSDPAYEPSRSLHSELVEQRDSALKIEISQHLAALHGRLPKDARRVHELDLFRRAQIDGIITTNFDGVIEELRPDLVPYVGQDELFFAGPLGVGEIYKIHGSWTRPNSLVLTAEDYADFHSRNAYLAAKLMTVFVERPVVFLGYSFSDKNVRSILHAIAECMRGDRVETLRDRLIFVEWVPHSKPTMAKTEITVEGHSIPIHRVEVPDFVDVFTALADIKRTIPARLLRHLREEVQELVATSEPTSRVFVEELEPGIDPSGVEVYAGFGAIAKVTTSYVGLDRFDLLNDALDDRGYDPRRVVFEALGAIGNRKTLVPIRKYLAGAGLLSPNGKLKDRDSLPPRVVARFDQRPELLKGLNGYEDRGKRAITEVKTLAGLARSEGLDNALLYLPFIPYEKLDPDELGDFLQKNREPFDNNRSPAGSAWCRAVCIYDWLKFGGTTPSP